MLRQIYREWYAMIAGDLRPGKTLELGSGIGNFKKFKPEIISSDIVKCEWLDKRVDAHRLPFSRHSLANIVMIDVLHHLGEPLKFFDEAERVLKPDGRVVIIEPFPSPVSIQIYRLFHPEPFIFKEDVFTKKNDSKPPWDSNQAIPYLLFFKHRDKFEKYYKNKLKIVKIQKFSFILYPLSGGFEHRSLLPVTLFPLAKKIENWLIPLRNLLAFRCYIVLEKIP